MKASFYAKIFCLINLIVFCIVIIAPLITTSSVSVPNQVPVIQVKSEIIDEKIILKTLKDQAQIVSSEGVIEKEYKYTDNILKTNTMIDKMGERQFNQKIFVKFKMGLDMDDIKVLVKENTVFISTAKPVIISLEVDEIFYDTKKGLLRVDLTDSEKFYLLSKAKESVRKEILADNDINYYAKRNAQKIIENLLKQIPFVKEVKFI